MKLLSAAEEIMLARRIERGDLQGKQRMIESNLRLVTRGRQGLSRQQRSVRRPRPGGHDRTGPGG